jgi:hypothetical protein
MEFMALPGFTPAHHKPVPLGDRLAVAEAEAAAPGPEGQQPCHRMDLAGRIDQLLAEQQQATAFRVDRQPPGGGPAQLPQAALAVGQLGPMQFGIAARQPANVAIGRRRFITQGREGHDFRPRLAPAFQMMGIDEGEGDIASERDALARRRKRQTRMGRGGPRR